MGWSVGYDTNWDRDIGYGVPSVCDKPDCTLEIDRGLSYVCGNEPYGGEKGCGLYFCSSHLFGPYQLCPRCVIGRRPYRHAKPDTKEWMMHKLTDSSWAAWRAENPAEVGRMAALLNMEVL